MNRVPAAEVFFLTVLCISFFSRCRRDTGEEVVHRWKEATVEYYRNTAANDLTEITVRETFQRWDEANHFTCVYKGRNRAGLRKDGKSTVSFMLEWPEKVPMKTCLLLELVRPARQYRGIRYPFQHDCGRIYHHPDQ